MIAPMTLELQVTLICFGLASLGILWLGVLTLLRWAVFHVAARATHDFYVAATGTQPRCATCPFNAKCPYSNGIQCHFSPAPYAQRVPASTASTASHTNPMP